MNLEQRAEQIAHKRGCEPGSMRWRAVRDEALRHLKEVADQADRGGTTKLPRLRLTGNRSA